MQPARKSATYEDLVALPAGVKAEIVDGVIVTPPAPLPRHSSVQGKLRRLVGGAFDDDDGHGGPGGWWIFLEVDVPLAEDRSPGSRGVASRAAGGSVGQAADRRRA